jgi:hypothetical protein
MAQGWIYFLENDAMPGLIKVGYTVTDLHERLAGLDTTGVPSPFVVAAAVRVNAPGACEAEVHRALAEHRHAGNREFFRVSRRQALTVALPILLQYLGDPPAEYGSSAADVRTARYGDVSKWPDEMLLDILGNSPELARDAYDLARNTDSSMAKTTYVLHALRRKGYVQEARGSRGDLWELTEKGISFVVECGLLVEDR